MKKLDVSTPLMYVCIYALDRHFKYEGMTLFSENYSYREYFDKVKQEMPQLKLIEEASDEAVRKCIKDGQYIVEERIWQNYVDEIINKAIFMVDVHLGLPIFKTKKITRIPPDLDYVI